MSDNDKDDKSAEQSSEQSAQPSVDEQWAPAEPELPVVDSAASLNDIVGAGAQPPTEKKKILDWAKRSTKIAVGGGVGAVLLALVILLSWLNARDYYLVCGAEQVTAQRGKKFPWGRTRLSGKQWAAIKMAPESGCVDKTFATVEELREVFTQMIIQEASGRLRSASPDNIDEAERQLAQALLLTRSIPSKRAIISSLQGDLQYWRAASEVNTVIEQLENTGARFKAAADKKPRHSTDAPQWSGYAADMAKQLRRGPPELRSDQDLGPDAPPPFAGTDTAPAPPRDTAPRDTTPAGLPTGVALPPQADAGPPPARRADAGLPTGGVLL